MSRLLGSVFLTVLVVLPPAVAIAPADGTWHHVHLSATSEIEGATWYAKHLGGRLEKFDDRLHMAVFGDNPPTHLLFFERKDFAGSAGSSIDHLGWSVPDVDAAVQSLVQGGAKLATPAATAPGGVRRAILEDPWGTRIALVSDRAAVGFHHVTLPTVDVDATVQWYLTAFGGERAELLGRPAVKYGSVRIAFEQVTEARAPTRGRSIDHLGWMYDDIDAEAEKLRALGVKFTMEPRVFFGRKIAFVEGPGGVRIELVKSTLE